MTIKINPDQKVVKQIRKKIKENGGYCPCKLEKTSENMCICDEFMERAKNGETGYCHCGLYYTETDD